MLPRVPNLSGKKDMTRREDDSFQRFLLYSDKVFRDARFVADSLPNVEPFAVQRALCRLQAVHHILINTQDPWVKPDEVKLLADSVVSLHMPASLDETRESWNLHKMRTEHFRLPQAMYELSRTKAIREGYWPNPGDDDVVAADPEYSVDGEAPEPPAEESNDDPMSAEGDQPTGADAQREAGIVITDDGELEEMRTALENFDFTEDDGNFGIDVYLRAVALATAYFGSL
ncbi:hypothetical protein GGX14DRAFT_404164 [Mycena pura]|uniref:Uncharacterized protein n=1 Tax=Mycena pura TaxID=153505 RepID=A0AAD6UUR9_9AGAR|nr:hypothetical protein GGX14DRAFT_404164 [Mycena pura]